MLELKGHSLGNGPFLPSSIGCGAMLLAKSRLRPPYLAEKPFLWALRYATRAASRTIGSVRQHFHRLRRRCCCRCHLCRAWHRMCGMFGSRPRSIRARIFHGQQLPRFFCSARRFSCSASSLERFSGSPMIQRSGANPFRLRP